MNADALFEEDTEGSPTPGRLTDVVVLSEDVMKIPQHGISGTKWVQTILGSRVAYTREMER